MPDIRINLGSGDRYIDGACNVDLYAKRADVRQDIRTVSFPENYAAEISCIHTIEHIDRAAGEALIEKCFLWLKPGGRLEIETPDRKKCEALMKLKSKANRRWELMGAHGLHGGRSGPPELKAAWRNWLLGWVDSGQPFDPHVVLPPEFEQPGHRHYYVWTAAELDEAMKAIGFSFVVHMPPKHHGGRDKRDCRIVGIA